MTVHSSALTMEMAISQAESVRYLRERTDLVSEASATTSPQPGSGGTETEPAKEPASVRHWARRILLAGVSLAALAAAASYGWEYWTVGRFEVSTDNAYVQADNTTIAPKVSGYISA